MSIFSNKWAPHWGTLLSSVLIVAAYPPWGMSWLIWICLIPWLHALVESSWSRKRTIIQGVWLSIGMSCLGFHWVGFVLHEFANVPWVVAGVGLVLYSFVGQLQFPIFALFFRALLTDPKKPIDFTRQIPFGRLMWIGTWLGLLYTGLDWALPKLFKDTLGHALYNWDWIRQVADLGGAHLLTFAVFGVNFALFVLWKSKHSISSKLALAGFVCIPIIMSLYGAIRESQIQDMISRATSFIQGASIQANIGDFDKIAAERGISGASQKVLDEYMKLSNQALTLQPKPDFVVWPETAYPATYRHPVNINDLTLERRIEGWVKGQNSTILFGGYDHERGKDFNALFIQTPDALPSEYYNPNHANGWDLQYYRKNILLMFGEYIPGQDIFPILGDYFPQVGNFGKGIGPDVLVIPRVDSKGQTTYIKTSPLICYEILFTNYVLKAANQGSQLILNVTNDSWFGPYGEPHLHLALSTFRSVETRLPIFRSTNTGFSAVVLQDGSIGQKTRLFEPEILNYKVPLFTPPATLIKSWGDWFGWFSLLVALGVFAAPFISSYVAKYLATS